MSTPFQTEEFEAARQLILEKKWKELKFYIQECGEQTYEDDYSLFIQFVLEQWEVLKETPALKGACWCLLEAMDQSEEGITEELALDIASHFHRLADDADQYTYAYKLALGSFPDSDTILTALIEAGADTDGYYYEDAFSSAARSGNPDRNNMLRALEALCTYNYYQSEGQPEEAENDMLDYIGRYASYGKGFGMQHVDQAMERVKEDWHLPEDRAAIIARINTPLAS